MKQAEKELYKEVHMNIFQRLITRLFFKHCYRRTISAEYLICYFVPDTIRKEDGSHLTGSYLFGQINEKTASIDPVVDVWKPDSGNAKTLFSKPDFDFLKYDTEEK